MDLTCADQILYRNPGSNTLKAANITKTVGKKYIALKLYCLDFFLSLSAVPDLTPFL